MRIWATVLLAACGGDDVTEPRGCEDFEAFAEINVYRDTRGALECAFEFHEGQDPSRIFPDGYAQSYGYPRPEGRFWITLAWTWERDEGKAGTVVRVGGPAEDRCQWVRSYSDGGALGEGGACPASPSLD